MFQRILLYILVPLFLYAQIHSEKTLKLLENEKWWGGNVVDAPKMPYGDSTFSINLDGYIKGNQAQPLLISDKGRYVWCNDPIEFTFKNDSLNVLSNYDTVFTGRAGSTLKEAFVYSSKTFFSPQGKIPDEMLFTLPQYNTWIELMYDQNQVDILKYAHAIIDNGYPPGVLMIDDNWNRDYGDWDFKTEKFPDPKKMISELHELGFKVMLWVCPFVSPDGQVYRKYRNKPFFLMEDGTMPRPAMITWWNGVSAVLDLTNPEAVDWFNAQLQYLIDEYSVDGFKLDAGDPEFYDGDVISDISANDHCELFAKIGLNYSLNEYRACWKMAGQPLVQRLRDKSHKWEDLQKLIPGILAQGLMGYAFTCPDMIGGGEFMSFLTAKTIDEELIVRSAQCHVLMPMMQFSVAPWRILSAENNAICQEMANLHSELGGEILALAKASTHSGEPIVRSLEYEFPDQGYAEINDQFLLGNSILVAPVLYKGQIKRTVIFPKGRWQGDDGSVVAGPCEKVIEAPLERLPWFRKL